MNVYEVSVTEGFTLLVQAKSKSGARAFAAKRLAVERVSALRAHTLASRGIEIEDATKESDEHSSDR